MYSLYIVCIFPLIKHYCCKAEENTPLRLGLFAAKDSAPWDLGCGLGLQT